MFGILLVLFFLVIAVYHFTLWKPLDTSVLYRDQGHLLFGHRGSPLKEPENTIPSFKQAVIDGCNAIELDVYSTKDGHLVVFHDTTLTRTTNGTGRVADQTLIQLQTLNAANLWPGRSEQIPTLRTVIGELPQDIVINIEIKNYSFFSKHHTERAIIEVIHEKNLQDRVILSSFHPLNIWRVKRLDPTLFTAFLWYNPGWYSIRNFLAVHLAHPDILHTSQEEITSAVRFWSRLKKIPLHVWVVNEAEQMKQFMHDPLVKGIMSDDAQLLAETIGEV